MALQKTKTTHHGVDGDYWRILQLNCNYDRSDAVCTVVLYLNEAARNAGNSPVDSFQIDLAVDYHDGQYVNGDDAMKNISLKEAYKTLKQMAVDESTKPKDGQNADLAFFSDTVDV